MRLLGHNQAGTWAMIQLEDGGHAYEYEFGPDITTFTLVRDPETHMVPGTWITDFPDGNTFETVDQIKDYLQGKAVVVRATPHDLAFADE